MKLSFFSSKLSVTTLLLVLGLAACGGGGGGGGTTSQNPPAASVWTGVKQIGVAGAYTSGGDIALDASGNVYATGRTEGNLDGNSTSGSRDFVLVKYDSVGARQYVKQLHAPNAETTAIAVATDASGNVYVAGYTFGAFDGNTQTGNVDLILTKFDSSGAKQFSRQFGVAGHSVETHAVAVDSNNGFVYVVGFTTGGLNGNTQTGTTDAFLAQYTTAGNLNYVRQLGTATKQTDGQSVAVDASGNVYVAGNTEGGLNGNTLTGTRDAFLAQYTSAGTLTHVAQVGAATKVTYGESVAIDTSGNVYLAGSTQGGLNGNTLTGTTDIFLARYVSGGSLTPFVQYGIAGAEVWANGLTVAASGDLYVAGTTYAGLNGNTLTGTTDAFFAKFSNTGTLGYVRQLGISGVGTWGRGIAVDASGNTFLGGGTYGNFSGNAQLGTSYMFVTKYNSSGALQ